MNDKLINMSPPPERKPSDLMVKILVYVLVILVLLMAFPAMADTVIVRFRAYKWGASPLPDWAFGDHELVCSTGIGVEFTGSIDESIAIIFIESTYMPDLASVAGPGISWDDSMLSVNVTGPVEIDGDAVDIADNGINDTHIDWGLGGNQVGAFDVPVDITNFDGNLTGADSDVQTALESIDEIILTGGVLQYFLETTASDIGGYKVMAGTYAADAPRNSGVVIIADATAIEEWATAAGQPDATILLSGVYQFHLHALQVDGTKTSTIYFELYKRASGGGETLLGTSEETGNLTGGSIAYEIHLWLTEQAILATDRLVLKALGNEGGTGTDPEVQIDFQDDTLTRFSLPGSTSPNQTSLADAYGNGRTIDPMDTGPMVLNHPDGGTTDAIAEVLGGVNFNIRNLWIQANDADVLNVNTLYYTETDDITPTDFHLMGIMSTDSGTNKYRRWYITSLGVFTGTGLYVRNYPIDLAAIHQILPTGATFNVQQSDIDFTVRSDNHSNAIKVNAGEDTISIAGTEFYIGDADTKTPMFLADGSGNYVSFVAQDMTDDYEIEWPAAVATTHQVFYAESIAEQSGNQPATVVLGWTDGGRSLYSFGTAGTIVAISAVDLLSNGLETQPVTFSGTITNVAVYVDSWTVDFENTDTITVTLTYGALGATAASFTTNSDGAQTTFCWNPNVVITGCGTPDILQIKVQVTTQDTGLDTISGVTAVVEITPN